MATVRLISKRDIEQVLTLDEVIRVVEEGFEAQAAGTITTFPVVMEHIPKHNAFFGIKSGYVPSSEALWVKVAWFWPRPQSSSIPGHFAMIFSVDEESGIPLAFMDGNLFTAWCTGRRGL